MNSNLFSLNWKDLAKGAALAVITVLVTQLYQSFAATPVHWPTLAELKADCVFALAAGVSYFLKNFLSGTDGEILKK
jgi:hypothetical protein